MNRQEVVERIRTGGLVPVVRTTSAEDALAMCQVLHEAGLTAVEITLTVPGAVDVIAALVGRFGDRLVVGAGTVLTARSAQACIDAGATFIVSPGLDLPTVAQCRQAGTAIFPGALTPTEVITAWNAGADMVKIFPASAMGGASYIKALKAPLPEVEMLPTGGVSVETVPAFIEAGAAALGVGADLVNLKSLREGRLEIITERAQQYLAVLKTARGG